LLLKISVGVGLRETDAVGYDIHGVILRLKSRCEQCCCVNSNTW
jgi:hypothetical protein